jgi:hypothetical protein
MDLLVPLPEWTKDDLKDVVLYTVEMSPPSCKIRAILQYNEVVFMRLNGIKPGDDYRRVPVLVINQR